MSLKTKAGAPGKIETLPVARHPKDQRRGRKKKVALLLLGLACAAAMLCLVMRAGNLIA
jgi:hypothetical protein